MPDDERTRRRLGDETKSRIADLASGWTVESPAVPAVPVPPAAPIAPSSAVPPGPETFAPDTEPRQLLTPDPDVESVAALPAPPAAPRSKPKTNPPPPPGSPERKALEDKIAGTRANEPAAGAPPPPTTRGKPGSVPPPPPGSPERAAIDRSRPTAAPAAIDRSKPTPAAPTTDARAKYPRATYDGPQAPFATEQRTFASEQRTPAVIVEDAVETSKGTSNDAAADVARRVPVGEFDSGTRTIEKTKSRRETIPEADADLLEDDDGDDAGDVSGHDGVARHDDAVARHDDAVVRHDIAADKASRGDATTLDPQTTKFERGDPTNVGPPDATQIESPRTRQHTGGTLRRSAQLRRKRGLAGDVRYVFTAVFGVQRARRELAELERRQELRQTSRRRHLVTLGRTAAVMDGFDHPALGKSRDQLSAIEDERSQHAGAVAASDAELERVRRDRETKSRQLVDETATIDAELAELAKKLEPLEKEATAARKRAQDLRDELHRIERKISDTEALLVSVKAEKMDKAAIHADIATYKANKQAVLRDEPVIAAALDALNPRIAAMEATRSELQKKKAELDKADKEDQRRTLELLEAIGAKRKVVERASADAEAARDTALFELGERLYVDRPSALTHYLSPIDQIDLELGEGDRRAMELKEILSNVDRWKLARGLAMIILFLAAVGSFVAWVVYMLW